MMHMAGRVRLVQGKVVACCAPDAVDQAVCVLPGELFAGRFCTTAFDRITTCTVTVS
jgi:hypothetical protein